MKPGLRMHIGQQMTMTPQLLQSIRLLQLSSLELEQEVQQALETNVMLEPDEAAAVAEIHGSEAPVTGCDAGATEKVEADFDWSSAEGWSGGEAVDEDGAIEERTAAPETTDVRVRALEQLRLVLTDGREARIALAIVEAVDDNGYLDSTLDEISASLPSDMDVCIAEVEQVLRRVQSVEPAGFASRDLRECLLLQLRDQPPASGRDLATLIVSGCLERVATRDFDQLKISLDVSSAEIEQAVNLILALNPKPGAALVSAAQAIVPDLIVSGEAGQWKVELNPATLPRVRINSLYERLLNGGAGHRGLREQLQEARWLVRGLEMRHETLLKTARVVFQRQGEFLKNGEEGMAALTLREVAEAISMHESTVSRVTTNKYVETPWGIYELKAFFPSHLGGVDGDTSGTAVRAVIRRIINGENVNAPLCDGAIAALLHRAGVKVARRTVAKYREAMKILPAKDRRQVAQRHALRMAG
jgi:RNA polymerase sigma-54 factor